MIRVPTPLVRPMTNPDNTNQTPSGIPGSSVPPPALAAKYRRLYALIESFQSTITAFSGGVDSSLVAYLAHRALGSQEDAAHKALAVTSASVSLSRADLSLTQSLAASWDMAHRIIETTEVGDPDYAANPVNRCYFCKTNLYSRLGEIAERDGYDVILNGTNVDDLGDFRPGLKAAGEHSVRSPLAECGMTKPEIRALAAYLGLPNADKPQAACLSSRVPYGTPITPSLLGRIDAAESLLREMGFGQLRVRDHGDVARIEIMPEEFERLLAKRQQIDAKLATLGYRFVALDLKGFRSGAMNEGLDV